MYEGWFISDCSSHSRRRLTSNHSSKVTLHPKFVHCFLYWIVNWCQVPFVILQRANFYTAPRLNSMNNQTHGDVTFCCNVLLPDHPFNFVILIYYEARPKIWHNFRGLGSWFKTAFFNISKLFQNFSNWYPACKDTTVNSFYRDYHS